MKQRNSIFEQLKCTKNCRAKLFVLLFLCDSVNAEKYIFERDFLADSEKIDLTLLESSAYPSGRYYVSLYLNGEYITKEYMYFDAGESEDFCIQYSVLQDIGVTVSGNQDECANLDDELNLRTRFDFYSKRMDIFVSPKFVPRKKNGLAPIKLWDEGENALFTSYNFSEDYYHFKGDARDSYSQYANIQPRLNIGPWRIRTQAIWNKNNNTKGEWSNNYLYAERGLGNIKSRLYIGDGYFPLKNFNSFKFKGGVLKTDENMYPYSEKTYSPIVKGSAKTQAKVEFFQDGVKIYSSIVPPGDFSISDYILSGSNSDLYVKVIEENGSIQEFIVPFTYPAVAVREGFTYYEIAMGETQQSNDYFTQLSFTRGLPYDFTVLTSLEYSGFYRSLEIGLGKMLGNLGALSLIYGQSNFSKSDNSKNKKWDIRYNKNIPDLNTYLSFSAVSQTRGGYSSLRDALDYEIGEYTFNSKNSYTASINHSLGELGSLNFSGTWRNYWENKNQTRSYNLSYSTQIFNGKAYLSGSLIRSELMNFNNKISDTILNIGVNIPFGLSRGIQSVSYNTSSVKGGRSTHQLGISGSEFDNKLYWHVNQGYSDNYSNTSMYGYYKAKYAQVNAGYSVSERYNHAYGGIEGGILVYDGGIILGRNLGDTMSIIEAPGAENTKIRGWGSIETDWRGRAFIGYLSPYQNNDISLDPSSLPLDSSLDITTNSVIPTTGAIVKTTYNVKKGKKVMLTLKKSNGDAVPFGAIVTVMDGDQNTSIVGDNGQLYLGSSMDTGRLKVIWGNGEDKKCVVDYMVGDNKNIAGIYIGSAGTCI